jgi:hypothetical protein
MDEVWDKGLFNKNGSLNLQDYEIVPDPIPENETPRQTVLRMTGKDYPELTINGQDLTWQELKDVGAMPLIGRIIQLTSAPRLYLRKKQEADHQ